MTEPDPPEPTPFEPIESPYDEENAAPPPVGGTAIPHDGVVLDDTPVVRPVPQPPAGPAQPPITPLTGQADESDDGEH